MVDIRKIEGVLPVFLSDITETEFSGCRSIDSNFVISVGVGYWSIGGKFQLSHCVFYRILASVFVSVPNVGCLGFIEEISTISAFNGVTTNERNGDVLFSMNFDPWYKDILRFLRYRAFPSIGDWCGGNLDNLIINGNREGFSLGCVHLSLANWGFWRIHGSVSTNSISIFCVFFSRVTGDFHDVVFFNVTETNLVSLEIG